MTSIAQLHEQASLHGRTKHCLTSWDADHRSHEVTNYLQVQLMVQVLVDLLGVSVLAQQPAQDTQATHPEHLGGQPGLPGSPPLPCADLNPA